MSNESSIVVDDGCDESKCVTWKGISFLELFDNSLFTCYSYENVFPMACIDGYKPRIVKDEPTRLAPLKFGVYDGNYSHQYFTCCRPDLPADTNVTRHCTDSHAINNETVNICKDNRSRRFERMMATPQIMGKYPSRKSFVCCDNILENSINMTTNFLDGTDCVPFRSGIYFPTIAFNIYGQLIPVSCDNSGIYESFTFPRKVEKENAYGISHYECCKTKSNTDISTFIRDKAFNTTVYPQIVVSSIAVFSCTLLILALSIPLFLHLKKQRTQAPTTTTTAPAYSSYNLYLVFLAIPDLLLNLYLLGICCSYVNDTYNPNFKGLFVIIGGSTNYSFVSTYS